MLCQESDQSISQIVREAVHELIRRLFLFPDSVSDICNVVNELNALDSTQEGETLVNF